MLRIVQDVFMVALNEYGVTEVKGSSHEARVLQYFKDIGHSWVKDDETAWCAAFWNWCLLRANRNGSGKLNARSFLNVGKEVSLNKVRLGDTVVLWRESKDSWKGHVGGYVKHDKDHVWLIGGNQNNQVNISKYHINRILSIRRI